MLKLSGLISGCAQEKHLLRQPSPKIHWSPCGGTPKATKLTFIPSSITLSASRVCGYASKSTARHPPRIQALLVKRHPRRQHPILAKPPGTTENTKDPQLTPTGSQAPKTSPNPQPPNILNPGLLDYQLSKTPHPKPPNPKSPKATLPGQSVVAPKTFGMPMVHGRGSL